MSSLRHGTMKAWLDGCDCDGCRLSAFVTVSARARRRQTKRTYRYRPTMLAAAPYRKVLLAVLADSPLRIIAEFSGVSAQSLSRIARGEVTHLRLDTARKLRRLVLLLPEDASA